MRARAITAGAVAALLATLTSPAGGSTADQLPNLVALAPFDFEIAAADSGEGQAIRFATGAANRGDHALELLGQPSSPTDAIAQQCVAWAHPRICTQRDDVGTFAWHPQHGHYHFEEFALYELRRLRPNGRVRMAKNGLVRTSGKISYCIIDAERDDSSGDSLYFLPYPLYYSCLAGLNMQGISPTWRDIYSNSTVGQEIPLDGIEDGTYALVIHIDPSNRLHETDDSDNTSLVKLRILDGGRALEILCAQEPGTTCAPTAEPE